MSGRELVVLLGGEHAGTLRQTSRGSLTFTYDAPYIDGEKTPLSLSMPPQLAEHRGRAVTAFLWGLLPDNDAVLDRWGRQFHVSARNPFALLSHVGQDCAGAVQFVAPDRLDSLSPGGVDWLDVVTLGNWVRTLRQDPAAWLPEAEHGQFSLAGAQSKFALLRQHGRWGRPFGAVPTTHIVKPTGRFATQELNEHLCLATARRVGLPAAESEVLSFDGEAVLVVERYDRVKVGADWLRVHQEDMCQAMAVHPNRKYLSDGGPGVGQVAQTLRSAMPAGPADAAVRRFIQALVFNWLIGGTDAHAKNFSVLLSGRQVRLAPLYDLVSALPYAQVGPAPAGSTRLAQAGLQLAMKVGGSSRLYDVNRADWGLLATSVGLPAEEVWGFCEELASQIPDELSAVASAARAPGTWSKEQVRFGSTFVDVVAKHVRHCLIALAGH